MKDTDIIIALRNKLDRPVGRHLYGVLGTYDALDKFESVLKGTKTSNGVLFSNPVSVNKGIINAFSDNEFRSIVKDEARRPEPTRASIKKAFEQFLRKQFAEKDILILKDLEILFPYNIDLNPLRTLATDEERLILLLPGRQSGERLIMYPNIEGEYKIPKALIAENHLWEVTY